MGIKESVEAARDAQVFRPSGITSMRAKLKINRIEQFGSSETLHFNAVCAKAYPADGSDEDNTFAKFTPSATLAINITNPALIGQFKAGEVFHVDFTKAPD
jgi:hypothetical protein